MLDNLTFQALSARKLTEESCRKWGYGCGTAKIRIGDNEFYEGPVQVANYYSPDGTKVVAQKVRMPNKDFRILGNADAMGLYGMHLWRDGGKSVVITEGEIDAISVGQVQDHKWPVVSIPNGASAAAKAIAKCSDWLEKFESVVLMFDMDEPGQKAAKECAELLTPGKVKIASLPLKDANEMLKAARGSEIVNAYFAAKPFRPDGIVSGTDLWDRIRTPKEPGVSYPWKTLTDITHGRRRGEIVLVGAGTGVGKSELTRAITYDALMRHNETIGVVALEEAVERSSLGLMGLHMGRRLHVDQSGVSVEEMRAAYDATVGNGRVFLYDHWGSTDSDNLIAKLKYMVRGCGCTTVLLDHISIVVSGIEDGDERRIIDNTMTRLRSLTQEVMCRMIVVAHLKSIEGTPHEEGGKVSLSHFRGSKALVQLSDTVLGLERDQQDEKLCNYTHLRVLKNRHTGQTGSGGWLWYDAATGRMHEKTPVFDDEPKDTNTKLSEDF